MFFLFLFFFYLNKKKTNDETGQVLSGRRRVGSCGICCFVVNELMDESFFIYFICLQSIRFIAKQGMNGIRLLL